MRKIVIGAFVSLDGVMQGPGGPEEDRSGGFELGGWTVPHFDEVAGAELGKLFSAPFELLLGRRTYDIFAAHWPEIGRDPSKAPDDAGIARVFNATKKHVLTHRAESLSWEHSVALGDDPVAYLRSRKQEDGPMLLTQGSTELLQLLLENDLVDEIRLLTFPIVLAKGKRLFGAGTKPTAFRVASSVTSPSGVVIATYERAGAVETGSFALT